VCGVCVVRWSGANRNRKDILSLNYPNAIINSETAGPSVASRSVYYIHIIWLHHVSAGIGLRQVIQRCNDTWKF